MSGGANGFIVFEHVVLRPVRRKQEHRYVLWEAKTGASGPLVAGSEQIQIHAVIDDFLVRRGLETGLSDKGPLHEPVRRRGNIEAGARVDGALLLPVFSSRIPAHSRMDVETGTRTATGFPSLTAHCVGAMAGIGPFVMQCHDDGDRSTDVGQLPKIEVVAVQVVAVDNVRPFGAAQ